MDCRNLKIPMNCTRQVCKGHTSGIVPEIKIFWGIAAFLYNYNVVWFLRPRGKLIKTLVVETMILYYEVWITQLGVDVSPPAKVLNPCLTLNHVTFDLDPWDFCGAGAQCRFHKQCISAHHALRKCDRACQKNFFWANFSLVWIPIRLGTRIPQKNFKPIGQYFPLRKCDGKIRIYTENMLEHKVNIDGRSQNFFYSLWPQKEWESRPD